MAEQAPDNSLSDLSFDFLGGVQHPREEAAVMAPEEEAAPGGEPASPPAPTETGDGVVSAPRRHAWGFLYLLRTVAVILAVFLAGSLLLTMLLNPGLTFDEAVRLLLARAADVAERIRGLFG